MMLNGISQLFLRFLCSRKIISLKNSFDFSVVGQQFSENANHSEKGFLEGIAQFLFHVKQLHVKGVTSCFHTRYRSNLSFDVVNLIGEFCATKFKRILLQGNIRRRSQHISVTLYRKPYPAIMVATIAETLIFLRLTVCDRGFSVDNIKITLYFDVLDPTCHTPTFPFSNFLDQKLSCWI